MSTDPTATKLENLASYATTVSAAVGQIQGNGSAAVSVEHLTAIKTSLDTLTSGMREVEREVKKGNAWGRVLLLLVVGGAIGAAITFIVQHL